MPRAKASSNGKKLMKKTTKKAVKKSTVKTAPVKKKAKAVKKQAPKNKAVKKTAKKSTKKTSPKQTSKTQRSRKSGSTITPKSTSPKVRKKDVAATENTKSVALEKLFKKTGSKQLVHEEKEKTVSLPTNISIRAIERSAVIRSLVSDDTIRYARIIAFSFALLFVGFGSVFSLSQFGVLAALEGSQTAQVTGVDDSTSQLSSPPEPLEPPELTQVEQPPSVLREEFNVTFSLRNAVLQTVYVKNVETGSESSLQFEARGPKEYVAYLSPDNLIPGKYKIALVAMSTNLNREDEFTLGTFEVPTSLNVNTEEADIVDSQDTVQADDTSALSSDSSASPDIADTETVNEERPDVDDIPEETNIEDQSSAAGQMSFSISSRTFTNSQMVLTTAPEDIDSLELFVTPTNGFTERFVATGEKLFGTWRFYLDIENIPSGSYMLSAKAFRNDIPLSGEPIAITIEKSAREPIVTVTEDTESTETDELTDSSEVAGPSDTQSEPTVPVREFSELSLSPMNDTSESTTTTSASRENQRIVTELLRERKSSIELLLRNYSAAVQGGDESIVRLAEEAIQEERSRIEAERELTDPIRVELLNRFNSLQERISTFETLRRNSNDRETAGDSDGDGISDFDEVALFRTNPNSADTDDDGITDGVEILRGFNPLDSRAETAIVYESPRESVGLTRADVLEIFTVEPVIQRSIDGETTRIDTVITGQGLPNSYVTLFIFSSPTIVTVKTDDTGAFTYTFEKELEDGSHEIYVAITDNAGEIIAQSEPFMFVKEAEAFTVGARTLDPIVPEPDASSRDFGLIAGMGVLALGIILLMLGLGLKEEAIVRVNEATT